MTIDNPTIESNREISPANTDKKLSDMRNLQGKASKVLGQLGQKFWRLTDDQSKMSTSSFDGIL